MLNGLYLSIEVTGSLCSKSDANSIWTTQWVHVTLYLYRYTIIYIIRKRWNPRLHLHSLQCGCIFTLKTNWNRFFSISLKNSSDAMIHSSNLKSNFSIYTKQKMRINLIYSFPIDVFYLYFYRFSAQRPIYNCILKCICVNRNHTSVHSVQRHLQIPVICRSILASIWV